MPIFLNIGHATSFRKRKRNHYSKTLKRQIHRYFPNYNSRPPQPAEHLLHERGAATALPEPSSAIAHLPTARQIQFSPIGQQLLPGDNKRRFLILVVEVLWVFGGNGKNAL